MLEIPDKVIRIAVFLPPVLGLMWGLPAAFGVYVGALFVAVEMNLAIDAGSWLLHFTRNSWRDFYPGSSGA